MAVNPFDNFSPKAQEALTGSYQLLRQYRHNQLEVEHLLLSILLMEKDSVVQTLTSIGVDLNALKTAVQDRLGPLPTADEVNRGGSTFTAFITPRLQQVFTRAITETQPPRREGLGIEHLLLAMLEPTDDPVVALFNQFGVDREKLLQLWQAPQPSAPAQTTPPASELTHFNEAGRARMVDVSNKEVTARQAIAQGEVLMEAPTLALIREGRAKKGDVLAVAQIAGIMAAKKTHEIIPMCHPLLLTGIDLRFEFDEARSAVLIEAEVKTSGQTGVEMEALTAVSAAALTIYDMVKATDRGMRINAIRLVHKSGGKSGTFQAPI